jgi:hypothetical protein
MIAPAKFLKSNGMVTPIFAVILMGCSTETHQEKPKPETLTWMTMGGLVSTPKPNAAPHFAGTNLPAPPWQNKPWTAPLTDAPSNYVSAARAIFDAGFPDPRGCDYREVEVPTGNVWNGDSGLAKTHGWVFKHHGATFAVCWNGLIYPVARLGLMATLADDIRAMGSNSVNGFNNALPDAATVSHGISVPLRGCLLLRLGEGKLAYEFWAAHQLRAQQGQDATWARVSKTNSAPRTHVDFNPADPYLSWVSDWAWALFDRSLTAHMRGDDGLALVSVRELERVRPVIESEAERRGFGHERSFVASGPDAPLPYLHFTAPASALLKDQERRAREREAARAVHGRGPLTNKAEKIARLVQRLDQVAVRQMGQPGGLNPWSWDTNVSAVISEGYDAIEPLLHSLEADADQRLTRSVSFGRDFHRNRMVHSTPGVIVAALHAILHTTSFSSWATAEELAAAGTNNDRVIAANIRAYWKKFGDVTLEERWYRTLLDDKAGEGAWRDAIGNIVSADTSTPVHAALPMARRTNGPPQLRGESLRGRTNPSVTQLMLERYAQRQHQENYPFGALDPINYITTIARWDSAAAVPAMQELMHSYLPLWTNAEPREGSGEWHAMQWGRPPAAKGILLLTTERTLGGDTNALVEYAAWLKSVKTSHYERWQQDSVCKHDPFEPMMRFPTNATITNLVEFTFNDPRSPFSSQSDLSNGIKSLVVKYCGTELSTVPAFQSRLLEALQDRSPAGPTALLYTNNWVSINAPNSNSGFVISPPDEAKSVRGQPMKFRICDYVAHELSRWDGMPKAELYWTEAARDAAVLACRNKLAAEGSHLIEWECKKLPGDHF